MDKKGDVTFFRRKLFVPNRRKTEKHRGRSLLCFRQILSSKNFWIKGVSLFCRFVLSHSTEKIRKRTLVFQKCSGIEEFLDNRVSRFCRFFCLTVPKNFVGKSSVFLRISDIGKFYA